MHLAPQNSIAKKATKLGQSIMYTSPPQVVFFLDSPTKNLSVFLQLAHAIAKICNYKYIGYNHS